MSQCTKTLPQLLAQKPKHLHEHALKRTNACSHMDTLMQRCHLCDSTDVSKTSETIQQQPLTVPDMFCKNCGAYFYSGDVEISLDAISSVAYRRRKRWSLGRRVVRKAHGH